METGNESGCERTVIYRLRSSGKDPVGYVSQQGIYRLRWEKGVRIGRYESDRSGWRVMRATRFGEKESGTITADGEIRSPGLFEGGALGWLERDGMVMRGGLIFAEEEVGRVEGPESEAAAAALLLIFVPEEEEEGREMNRRG